MLADALDRFYYFLFWGSNSSYEVYLLAIQALLVLPTTISAELLFIMHPCFLQTDAADSRILNQGLFAFCPINGFTYVF